MKNYKLPLGIFFSVLFLFGCKKNTEPNPTPVNQEITSPEYQSDLLFVNSTQYQIQTSEPATFSSEDTLLHISASGLITRFVSGEVVPIDITWTNDPGKKTRIYAVAATDSTDNEPYAYFHNGSAIASNPYSSYLQGWETLHKLPVASETYAIILRHGDASFGRDNDKASNSAPANWWLSCDSLLARQLNTQGIERSQELGNVFRDLGFSFERVITSEFCRAKETADLIMQNTDKTIDARINHPSYNLTGVTLFQNMVAVMTEQPVDNKMTLLVAHHPINEATPAGYASFPNVSPFPWTGAYIIKIDADKKITYMGAVSWGMFKYFRDKKLNRL